MSSLALNLPAGPARPVSTGRAFSFGEEEASAAFAVRGRPGTLELARLHGRVDGELDVTHAPSLPIRKGIGLQQADLIESDDAVREGSPNVVKGVHLAGPLVGRVESEAAGERGPLGLEIESDVAVGAVLAFEGSLPRMLDVGGGDRCDRGIVAGDEENDWQNRKKAHYSP